ncbi:hypothetical protein BDU57DRAFT_513465 [Ampelomyces quisqualis]|uniref:Uncharacterized protein n=1 Tax=Ampelomyces quisqualis TaxID=50730 RepID=A0A6A5QNQ6_AMPQU|nr:hypothetical protein BDU57DRAFT_513465 [Ampelomyces quisqualis]
MTYLVYLYPCPLHPLACSCQSQRVRTPLRIFIHRLSRAPLKRPRFGRVVGPVFLTYLGITSVSWPIQNQPTNLPPYTFELHSFPLYPFRAHTLRSSSPLAMH